VDDAATVAWKGALAGIDHIVIRVPDLQAAVSWYQNLLGLAATEREPERVFLASPVTGRIVLGLSEGGTGLDYMSFRARTPEAFDLVSSRLDAAGVNMLPRAGKSRPGASDTLRITIPTGHTLEVVLAEDSAPAAPVSGYWPGAFDVRTSHLQLRTTDVKTLTEFFAIIGFRSSLYVPLPDSDGYFIQFLRVNEYHHQVAILTGRDGFHHVALEVDDVDFWRLLDNLQLRKIRAEYGPIRHHEGNMLSIYVRDPYGNRLEITGAMEAVGFDYPPTPGMHEPWYHMNMWGPQPPESWENEWM